MKTIHYILNNKGIKATKEPIYCDVDKGLEIIFDIPLQFRKYDLTASIITEQGQHISLKLVDYKATLPSHAFVKQTLFLSVSGECHGKSDVQWECEPVIIESLEDLTDKIKIVLPDYAALPLEVKALKAENAEIKEQIMKLTELIKEKQFIKQDILI